jgi:hemoglobin
MQVKIHDIENRKDIEALINSFYDKVKQDNVIGFIFNDVAKVNWKKHLPVMYNFWENLIFLKNTYSGNPMLAHIHLNELVKLKEEHFRRWLQLFTNTVDELYEGKNALMAKEKAISIATIIKTKLVSVSNNNISFKQ